MRRSDARILTTHTGSLPRPAGAALPGTPVLGKQQADPDVVRAAVIETVAREVATGIDVVSDGEVSKPSYSTYVVDRLTGFELVELTALRQVPDAADFPEYFARFGDQFVKAMSNPVCVGPIRYEGAGAVENDIRNLRAAGESAGACELFMTAASPGVIALFMDNRYYPSHSAYIDALAAAMRAEYEAITRAGIVLQLDCPDLAMWPVFEDEGMSKGDFLDLVTCHVEAINAATAGIDPDAMRMHVCWGNYEGPHTRDIPLVEILDRVLQARPAALLFEGANPRHAHEWAVFSDVTLPENKVLVPGVLDTTTNYVEHPELVADRLERLARIVGMDQVIAGTDCGFATFATDRPVDPRIVWAKLASMVEGAAIASARLHAG